MPTISSTELVRQKNSLLVLAAIRRHGNLSHTEMSFHTGLASATVSAITADLERATIIERTEQQASSGRGRPRVLFQVRSQLGYAAVVIISSDIVQYSLVNYGGKLIDRFSEIRQADGKGAFAAMVLGGLSRLCERSRIGPMGLLHISISTKGLVDAAQGKLVWSPVLGDEHVDFRDLLADGFQARVEVNNETLLVAEALWKRQRNKGDGGTDMIAALSLGHSIGLGLARTLEAGDVSVLAPNFGHMLHLADGALCRCGSRGCIEAYSGFYAILRAAFEVPKDTIPAKFVPLTEVDKIAASARSGNRMAAMAFRQAGLALGNGLSRLFSLHQHMPIYITGPGTRYFDLLKGGVVDGLVQSQAVRFGGLPEIVVEPDEQSLVFEGHMGLALSRIDEDIVMAGVTAQMPVTSVSG